MLPEGSTYPGEWLRIAEQDLVRVGRLLEAEDPELAGFCLQQAVEKFLKAFLLSRGWRLRRVHNLDALLDDALAYDASVERFRSACQRITDYYIMERYPRPTESELTEQDVRDSLAQVGELIERLRTLT